MERSSPLAALQPQCQPFGQWGFHPGPHASNPQHGASYPAFGVNSFDFRELSMNKNSANDYFASKPIRGSSPSASLAADLCQNFHIDRT
jgi:M-phase inducer tyrosine phosphatase